MLARLAPLAILVFLLAGCGGGGEGGPSTATPGADQTKGPLLPLIATALATAGVTPEGDATPMAVGTCAEAESMLPVIAACEDLAARFDRALGEIAVTSVTSKQWPDSCLGVAQVDEVCAEVITPGYEVVLKLDRNKYTYRTDETGSTIRIAGVDVFAD